MTTYDDDDEVAILDDEICEASEDMISILRYISQLSGETRANLLAFLHLAEAPIMAKGDLTIEGDHLTLKLFSPAYKDPENGPETESDPRQLQ